MLKGLLIFWAIQVAAELTLILCSLKSWGWIPGGFVMALVVILTSLPGSKKDEPMKNTI